MDELKDADLQQYIKAGVPVAGKSFGDGLTWTFSGKTASWILRYRFGGKQREVTIGNYPDMSIPAAKKVARAKRVRVDQGIDVASEKRKEVAMNNAAKTFRKIADDYLARAGKQLAERTKKEFQRYLDKDLLPRLGSIAARDIGPQDIVATVETIGKRSDSVARNAFEMLSVIFASALARSAVPTNPCAGLRLVDILGPRPPRRARVKLELEELRTLLSGLPRLGPVNALATKILLATCVRKGELVRARKQDLNLGVGTWWVPDEHSKGGKGFVVPLVPLVVGWFRELVALSGNSEWLLPALNRRYGRQDRHMSLSTLNAALARGRFDTRKFTPHDLRSTARSHLAALGVDVIVAERCLNHSLGGLVAVYDQHDYLTERRRALELWAKLLEDLSGGNVIPLRAAA
jgi:integrase